MRGAGDHSERSPYRRVELTLLARYREEQYTRALPRAEVTIRGHILDVKRRAIALVLDCMELADTYPESVRSLIEDVGRQGKFEQVSSGFAGCGDSSPAITVMRLQDQSAV
jgi:hypothetical protein